jgi:uncharacterized protein YbcC (UPF0753/DUF2309 family)
VIDAPQRAIQRVIERHAVLQQLLQHGWLHLWRFEGEGLQRYDTGNAAEGEAGEGMSSGARAWRELETAN